MAQGAGNVTAPVVASVLRFGVVFVGGPLVAARADGPWAIFLLVGLAMVVYGSCTALGVHFTRWQGGPKPASAAAPVKRPA